MAPLHVTTPLRLCVGIILFLGLIYIQMLLSLVCFGGQFISSNEILISPFRFCLSDPGGELLCDRWQRLPVSAEAQAQSETKTNITKTMIILCLYIPLVLVAFALLSMLLAVYGKDRPTLMCSAACQAPSSLLTQIGIVTFLLFNQQYVSWEHMTVWFYISLGTGVQLLVLALLTCHAGRRQISDWQPVQCYGHSSIPC